MSDDILSYNIGLIGEAGIGKSTLIKEVCEKLVGDDGYIMLNVGKEDGHDAINGIVSEDVPTWDKYIEVISDIVRNKKTDYPDLRIVFVDTYDQLIELAIPEVIRMHNEQNPKSPPIVSLKQAFGGFGAGEDKVIEIVLNSLWALKTVGVSFGIIGHVKKRDQEDPITGQSYTTLTTDLNAKYFNAIKNKLHVLGVASIDREIVREKTGKKNVVTKQDIVKGRVISESRIITFRDDNYTIDSKSRFSEIVDRIPLDPDAFIKALQDAINASKRKLSPDQEKLIMAVNVIDAEAKKLIAAGTDKASVIEAVQANAGTANYNKITDIAVAEKVYAALKNLEE